MLAIQSLQEAVFTVLATDITLSGQVSGVFDHVPGGTAYPYIVIGDSDSRDASTSTGKAEEIDFFARVYSAQAGKKQTQTVMQRITELLHDASLSLSGGYVLVNIRFASSAIQTQRDGLSHLGIMRFRAVVEE